jgi:hypothetical protein
MVAGRFLALFRIDGYMWYLNLTHDGDFRPLKQAKKQMIYDIRYWL